MSSQPLPLVSVIIPAYNYGHFIVETIESVLNQTYSNIEIIVVDDGSVDDTAVRLMPYSEKIRYYFKNNAGLSAARNTGMQLAKGDYIQFLDADDLLSETTIEHKVNFLNDNPDVAFCYCKTVNFNDDKPVRQYYTIWPMPREKEKYRALYYFNIAPPHAFLIRAIDVKKFNLWFDEALKACEDYDFWFRLALHTSPPEQVLTTKVFYRQHPGSMSKKLVQQYMHDAYMTERAFNTIKEGAVIKRVLKPEALVVLLLSSLITYRRLYFLDSEFAAKFYASFIKPLLMTEIMNLNEFSADADGLLFYLMDIRHLIIKITFKDKSQLNSDFHKVMEILNIDMFTGSRGLSNSCYNFKDKFYLLYGDFLDGFRLLLLYMKGSV